MSKFRKKPVVIEAAQWRGDNRAEIEKFNPTAEYYEYNNSYLINTLEGCMEARTGDWIIQGVNGEFYPCKPDIFEKTYDPVD